MSLTVSVTTFLGEGADLRVLLFVVSGKVGLAPSSFWKLLYQLLGTPQSHSLPTRPVCSFTCSLFLQTRVEIISAPKDGYKTP